MINKKETRPLENKQGNNIVLFALLGISSFHFMYQIFTICKARHNQKTVISEESKKEEKISISTQEGGFTEDFKTIFLLIISLLYGTLFFFLCENTINIVQQYSKVELSILCLQIAMYFRIIQTHLLAAIKYSKSWRIKSFDFLLIFLTAFFEYILIHISELSSDLLTSTPIAILIFAIYGIIGYIISLQRVMQRISDKTIKIVEIKIQGINIFVLLVIATMYIAVMLGRHVFFVPANFITAILLFINIYTSMHYSQYAFK